MKRTYILWQKDWLPTKRLTRKKQPAQSTNKKSKSANQPERRRRKFPYRKVADLEADIMTCETRIEELHTALSSPDVLRDGDRVKQNQSRVETATRNPGPTLRALGRSDRVELNSRAGQSGNVTP